MKLKAQLFGQTYQFKDVKDVLAKANDLRSGDVLAGVAAQSTRERVAAKYVLSELTLAICATTRWCPTKRTASPASSRTTSIPRPTRR